MATDKRQAWFCTTGLPSDVVIDVGDMSYHLHKFPLMAKSKKLHEMITEQETNPTSGNEREEQDDDDCHVTLPDFPGGPETFETAAKFCYAVKMELTATNVAALRCVGEVLEMTEEYCEENLISKTERFLSQTVVKSSNDSIKTLKSCEDLLPLAESLGIVQRCIDSIVSKASSSDPSIFGWPVNEVAASGAGIATGDSWFDELVHLSPSLFIRLISAIKSRNLNPELIENCLISYAKKHISGVNRGGRRSSSSSMLSEIQQKELLETIVSNLPEGIGLQSTSAITLFFGILRAANILKASNACKSTLERKIGLQLEKATLDDLLMPSYSYLTETLYDVECMQRILAHFLQSVQQLSTADVIEDDDGDLQENRARSVTLMLVGKLIDGYLSEIASDSNLNPEKFLELAYALPEQARLYDDGLYRSVDVYLKAHPWIKEADREKICGILDCRKLTLEACTHAAQNERLPLRAVVQVLFFEQLQLREAITGTLMSSADMDRLSDVIHQNDPVVEGEVERGVVAVRENQVLRLDMDSMRTRVNHLERECSTMRKAIGNIDKVNPSGPQGWRGSITKKFSCKFKTQVCDSHGPRVVEPPKSRTHRHQKQQ